MIANRIFEKIILGLVLAGITFMIVMLVFFWVIGREKPEIYEDREILDDGIEYQPPSI